MLLFSIMALVPTPIAIVTVTLVFLSGVISIHFLFPDS
jgi:hypothetical protein